MRQFKSQQNELIVVFSRDAGKKKKKKAAVVQGEWQGDKTTTKTPKMHWSTTIA